MRYLLLLLSTVFAVAAEAQSFSVAAASLNQQRISTDITGMKVLAAWGAFNTAGGIAGSLSSDREEGQRFYQMSAVFGVVNLSIAGLGYYGAKREQAKKYDCSRSLNRYESTRRIYLLNAGLDGLYISTGLYLNARAQGATAHPALLRGYGHALILQGAALLLFDVSMYTAHSRSSKGWYKAMQGICLTGDGIGLRYTL